MWSSNERWDLAGDALFCTVVRQVFNSLKKTERVVLGLTMVTIAVYQETNSIRHFESLFRRPHPRFENPEREGEGTERKFFPRFGSR